MKAIPANGAKDCEKCMFFETCREVEIDCVEPDVYYITEDEKTDTTKT